MSTPALNPLVEKIRAANPGAYDDMDDATLTKAVLAKYPQYSDLAAPKVQRPQVNIQAQPSTVGAIANRLISGPEGTPKSPSKVPKSIQNAPNALGEAIGGITGLGAAGMGAAAVPALNAGTLPFLGRMARGAVQQAPGLALAGGINYARSHLPFGKYIPMGAEYLGMLMGGVGGKGKAEPVEPAEVEGAPSPEEEPAGTQQPSPINTSPKNVGRLLEEGTGAQPLKPNVPLREQLPFSKSSASPAPAGSEAYIPVESSAINSYRYNPQANEFHVITKSGQEYVYGDVSPDQVQEFEQAESKGKAFGKIKSQSPLVRKGNIPVRPTPPPTGDLTDILTRSLRQVQGNQ